MKESIGEFLNLSGKMIVSDPCYDRGCWCAAKLDNVMRGTWYAEVLKSDEDKWGIRVAVLRAIHEGHNGEYFESTDFVLGVDSGQLGIYDESHYRDENVFSEPSKFGSCGKDEWYGHNCDVTLEDKQAGVIPFGCVSCSGYGDGSYGMYVARNDSGWVIGIEVVFIEDDAEGDEDDDDESVVS